MEEEGKKKNSISVLTHIIKMPPETRISKKGNFIGKKYRNNSSFSYYHSQDSETVTSTQVFSCIRLTFLRMAVKWNDIDTAF